MSFQPEAAQWQETENRFLTFTLGQECFGISIQAVEEVTHFLPITPMPEMPPYMKGVVQLREKSVPAVDMRIRMHKPEKPYDEKTCLLILSDQSKEFAFIIDDGDEVLEIPEENIAIPKFNFGQGENLILGVGKAENRFVLVLDSEALLRMDEIKI